GNAHRAQKAADRLVRHLDGLAGELRVGADDAGLDGETVQRLVQCEPPSQEKTRRDRPSSSMLPPPGRASSAGSIRPRALSARSSQRQSPSSGRVKGSGSCQALARIRSLSVALRSRSPITLALPSPQASPSI